MYNDPEWATTEEWDAYAWFGFAIRGAEGASTSRKSVLPPFNAAGVNHLAVARNDCGSRDEL
jgi:hypothetical protein